MGTAKTVPIFPNKMQFCMIFFTKRCYDLCIYSYRKPLLSPQYQPLKESLNFADSHVELRIRKHQNRHFLIKMKLFMKTLVWIWMNGQYSMRYADA